MYSKNCIAEFFVPGRAIRPPPADIEGVRVDQYVPSNSGPVFLRKGDRLIKTAEWSMLKPAFKDVNFTASQAGVPPLVLAPLLCFIPSRSDEPLWFLWCLLYQLLCSIVCWTVASTIGNTLFIRLWGEKYDPAATSDRWWEAQALEGSPADQSSV